MSLSLGNIFVNKDDPGEPGWVSCVGKSLRVNLRFLLGKQDPASDTASAPDSAASRSPADSGLISCPHNNPAVFRVRRA